MKNSDRPGPRRIMVLRFRGTSLVLDVFRELYLQNPQFVSLAVVTDHLGWQWYW